MQINIIVDNRDMCSGGIFDDRGEFISLYDYDRIEIIVERSELVYLRKVEIDESEQLDLFEVQDVRRDDN